MANNEDNKNNEIGTPSNRMKLLFITQKIDKDDDVLGVYHHWIEKLAEKFDQINVICLYRGRVELPDNVGVFSLGKEIIATKYEKNTNIQNQMFRSGILSYIRKNFVFRSLMRWNIRITYAIRFYRYIWALRKDYDRVFVHMNPEYMILAGFLWKISGKKPILWYNHPMGNWKARVAIALANRVLHTSPFAFSSRYKKSILMPVGIDTDIFRNLEIGKLKNSILYLGRISPIKKLEILLQAISILRTSGVQKIKLTIVGASTEGKLAEFEYYEKIKKMTAELDLGDIIEFRSPVPNYETPMLYNAHTVYVNMTPTGSFDKTIIEAMACELPVIVSNRALKEIFPAELANQLIFEEKNSEDLAKKLATFLNFSDDEKNKIGKTMRQLIVEKHSLNNLIDKLSRVLSS